MSSHDKLPAVMVVSEFPSISQTFISLQIAELVRSGEDLVIVNLGRTGKPEWAPENLKTIWSRLKIISIPNRMSVKPQFTKQGFCAGFDLWRASPGRMIKTIFKTLFRFRLYQFFDFLNDAALLKRCPPHRLVHCQFATLAHRVVRIRNFGLMDKAPPLLCSARGYDITSRNSLVDTDWPEVCRQTRMFLPVCKWFEPLIRNVGYTGEIRVVPSPVNTRILNQVSTERTDTGAVLRLVSVGRFVEKKGFLDGIEAVSRYAENDRNFEYYIIGDGPQKGDMEALIGKYGLSSKVFLTGPLPSRKTLQLMSECDILLAPCKTGSDGDTEGIPNVIKEAMYLGLQVIATRHAGIPELVVDGVNGFLVEEGDIEGIHSVLRKLTVHRMEWKERSDRARHAIEIGYSPEEATKVLLTCYNEAVSES